MEMTRDLWLRASVNTLAEPYTNCHDCKCILLRPTQNGLCLGVEGRRVYSALLEKGHHVVREDGDSLSMEHLLEMQETEMNRPEL